MNLIEMKSMAYDLIAKIELLQRELKELNAKILEAMQKENSESNATN